MTFRIQSYAQGLSGVESDRSYRPPKRNIEHESWKRWNGWTDYADAIIAGLWESKELAQVDLVLCVIEEDTSKQDPEGVFRETFLYKGQIVSKEYFENDIKNRPRLRRRPPAQLTSLKSGRLVFLGGLSGLAGIFVATSTA
jgi:hypothetical protein